MSIITRKNFLRLAGLSAGGLLVNAQAQEIAKSPSLDPALVKEFVTVGHGDLEKVKSMLAAEPRLLNACWDWGGGDFEAAIEGAGHVGSKDVVHYLLQHGARMNIFCAAMLGKLTIVKSFLSLFPELKTSKGPHNLTLIYHAKRGGEEAKEVLEYLQQIGAS